MAGDSFSAETVFAHPPKTGPHQASATTRIHGGTARAATARGSDGGARSRTGTSRLAHGSEWKIRSRHWRLWLLIADAALLADTATFWDNSTIGPPRIVATFSAGQPVDEAPWTSEPLAERWPRPADRS